MSNYVVTDSFSCNSFVVRAESESDAIRKVYEYEKDSLNKFPEDGSVSLERYIDCYSPIAMVSEDNVIEITHYS